MQEKNHDVKSPRGFSNKIVERKKEEEKGRQDNGSDGTIWAQESEKLGIKSHMCCCLLTG